MSDLYFGLNYWMKKSREKAGRNRYTPAEPVDALFKKTVFALCDVFGCTINVLPRELEDYFGKRLSDHGVKGDMDMGLAKYLSRAEAKKYKIIFKRGMAYQLPWWNRGSSSDLSGLNIELASTDSSRIHKDRAWRAGHGGYAMSMSREMYMGNHHCTNQDRNSHANFFHSSYLAGDPVLCAGTIKITTGVIEEVTNLSGHYKPTALHLLNVLKCLQMNDVDTSNIKFLLATIGRRGVTYAEFSGTEFVREYDLISKINELWADNWHGISNDVRARSHDLNIHRAYSNIKQSGMSFNLNVLARMAGVSSISQNKFNDIVKRFGRVESPPPRRTRSRFFRC
jgi:hypothetical protein